MYRGIRSEFPSSNRTRLACRQDTAHSGFDESADEQSQRQSMRAPAGFRAQPRSLANLVCEMPAAREGSATKLPSGAKPAPARSPRASGQASTERASPYRFPALVPSRLNFDSRAADPDPAIQLRPKFRRLGTSAG